jgi:ribosomal protein L19E
MDSEKAGKRMVTAKAKMRSKNERPINDIRNGRRDTRENKRSAKISDEVYKHDTIQFGDGYLSNPRAASLENKNPTIRMAVSV